MSNAESNHKEELFDRILPMLDQAIRSACRRYDHHSERGEIERLKSRLVWHLMEDDYRRLGSYREEAELNTWLQKIVNHYIYDFLKAERRNVSLEEFSGDAFVVLPDQETSLLGKERDAALEKALDKLTERKRTLFVLFCQGLSSKEIAQQIGVGEPTIYTYRHALIKELRLLMQSQNEHNEQLIP